MSYDANIVKEGRAILDIAESARLVFYGALHMGYGLRRGSEAETYLKMHCNSSLTVNGDFRMFFHSSIEVFEGGTLTLGHSYMNAECIISCAHSIHIGDGVAIARRVAIYDSDFHQIIDKDENQINEPSPISISDHVWIGLNAIILKGVTIGEGAIVAAGAVVTNDVPAHSMVAGCPARVIKEDVRWR